MYRIEGEALKKLIPLCEANDTITLTPLNNLCKGWALVDHVDAPKCAAVFHEHFGFVECIGQKPNMDMVKEITEAVIAYRSDRDFISWVDFTNYPTEALPMIEDAFEKVEKHERIVWEHDASSFMDAPAPKLPQGVQVLPIVKEDYQNKDLRFETLQFWDEAEDMLAHGVGVKAITQDHEIIGFCNTAACTTDLNEVDITVSKHYRKQGIGYAMAHLFAKLCYERGKKPSWDCLSHNAPSIALATKLGFQQVRRYKLLSFTYK